MNKTKINAIVVADSINSWGNRITSLLVTMPRIILAEFNTHRMFSRNTSSSRAIPFNKMVKTIEEDPFIPIAWQKDHKGMQGTEYLTHSLEIKEAEQMWKKSLDFALKSAKNVYIAGVTKQLCNRLLEPFMWTTVLVTATEWENFFALRCPQYGNNEHGFYKSKKDALRGLQSKGVDITHLLKSTDLEWLFVNQGQAEIHMMALAEAMWDAMNESTPKQLKAGEWHIPFGDNIDNNKLNSMYVDYAKLLGNQIPEYSDIYINNIKIKIATARCARVSYTVVGEEDKPDNYENDIKLHDRLIESGHWSPFEHCAKVPTEDEYRNSYRGNIKPIHIESDFTYTEEIAEINLDNCGWFDNFHGFQSYRNILENETSI